MRFKAKAQQVQGQPGNEHAEQFSTPAQFLHNTTGRPADKPH